MGRVVRPTHSWSHSFSEFSHLFIVWAVGLPLLLLHDSGSENFQPGPEPAVPKSDAGHCLGLLEPSVKPSISSLGQ